MRINPGSKTVSGYREPPEQSNIWKIEVVVLMQPCSLNLCSTLSQLNKKPRRSPLNNRVNHTLLRKKHRKVPHILSHSPSQGFEVENVGTRMIFPNFI